MDITNGWRSEGKMPERIIEANRSIVLAADVEPHKFEDLVAQMEGVEGLGGVKIGFEVGLGLGLRRAVDAVREASTDLKAVYDHQKAGNDIPDTGVNFARAMELADVDAAILFPFTGPMTQVEWTRELQDRGIKIISGAEMTHPMIQASEDGLIEGYVHPEAFKRMFALAVELGVRDFVVPGNKPNKVAGYKAVFDREIGKGEYTLWAPGFVTQGGDLSQTGQVAGENFHAIVGSGIYKNENPHQAAHDLGQKILALNNRAA
jgi:orotidine-5'-phosphate decarboxylase